MVGIYIIKSPTDGVYIGQSREMQRRWDWYKRIKKEWGQPGIHRSILKHGAENHKFEMLHELPVDIEQADLDNYEIFYIKQYRDVGFKILNLRDGGYRGTLSEESRLKVSITKKSRHFKHSEETKQIIREKRALQVVKKGYKKTKPNWNKGLKIGNRCKVLGRVQSDETREKIRKIRTGTQLPEHVKKKVSENNARYWKGKKFSEEHRRKLSESHAGLPSPKKGIKMTPEKYRNYMMKRHGIQLEA